ncbi:heterokaryon incompatibility, partial [Ampelomyces quisqualis]
EYCTLSYQWGSASHSCVLSDSFEILLEMAFETMPQTFKDAVIVARALGVRFLWIDALCIVQPVASGDGADWCMEGPRMGVIYEHAMFTIAA